MSASVARRVFAVLGAAALAVPLRPSPGLTWAVQPAGPGGPDGRRWIERTLDPGQVVTEHLAVRNFSATGVVFALKAADGYLTDKGRFTMLASGQASTGGGTWITVPPTVAVGANSTKVVPFTITVPRDASPGDHPAGIAASVVSDTGTVRVESRVGFRVLLRAGGAVRPAVSAARLTARYERSWNPLRSGALRVSYAAANTGNVRVEAHGRAEVSELFGAHDRARDLGAVELLPGGDRRAGARIGGVWGLGRLRTTVTLTPTVPGDTAVGAPVTVTVTTWVMPWAQLAAAAVVAALVPLTLYRRRRLRRLLDRARLEGRSTAASG